MGSDAGLGSGLQLARFEIIYSLLDRPGDAGYDLNTCSLKHLIRVRAAVASQHRFDVFIHYSLSRGYSRAASRRPAGVLDKLELHSGRVAHREVLTPAKARVDRGVKIL